MSQILSTAHGTKSPRKGFKSSTMGEMSLGDYSAKNQNVLIEFQDPTNVKWTQSFKYGLVFISIGLLLATVAAVVFLVLDDDAAIKDTLSPFETNALPNLDDICAMHNYGGFCFANVKVEFDCHLFTCTSYSIFVETKYSRGIVLSQKPNEFKLYVPNGHPCALNSWCVGGRCIETTNNLVPEKYKELNSTSRPGGLAKTTRCILFKGTSLVAVVQKQISELSPTTKFCTANDNSSLPQIDTYSCVNPAPKTRHDIPVSFCPIHFPFFWNDKSLEECKKIWATERKGPMHSEPVNAEKNCLYPLGDASKGAPKSSNTGRPCKTNLNPSYQTDNAYIVDGMCLESLCIPFLNETLKSVLKLKD